MFMYNVRDTFDLAADMESNSSATRREMTASIDKKMIGDSYAVPVKVRAGMGYNFCCPSPVTEFFVCCASTEQVNLIYSCP